MKKLALILGSLLLTATASAKEIVAAPVVVEEVIIVEEPKAEVIPEVKKWSLKTGVQHVERESGWMEDVGYDDDLYDDLGEGGDVTTVFTTIRYDLSKKWAFDYTYKYDYIQNDERFGKNKDGSKNSTDDGQLISHTVRAIRSFEPFELMGKDWKSKAYVGYRNYRESSIKDEDGGYVYNGFSSNRILAGADMGTKLTDATGFNLAYDYQYREYNYDNDTKDSNNQHRHWIRTAINHDFNDSFYLVFKNDLYMQQVVSELRNKGEWDPTYSLGHKLPLGNGYLLNTELTYWAEIGLWETSDAYDVDDSGQSEFIIMPKIKKTFTLAPDMTLDAFIGAGYVYGITSTESDETPYKGFEGRTGATINYKF